MENQLRINGTFFVWHFPLRIIFPQNQLLALDKENNAIQTTIHTNLLVESFYTTSHGSNNNLLSEMNEFTTNNAQNLTSPARENLLIDDSECTDECNRSTCNCINNEGDNNENYGECGKIVGREKSINWHERSSKLIFLLKIPFFRWLRRTMPRKWLNRTMQSTEFR